MSPRRRGRAHQTESVLLRIAFKMEHSEKQVFVKVAGDQSLLDRVAVEEGLPGLNLGFNGTRQRRHSLVARTALEPVDDAGLFADVEAGQTVRHPPVGMLRFEGVHLCQRGAHLLAVDAEVEGARKDALLREWVASFELEHAIEQAAERTSSATRTVAARPRTVEWFAPRAGARLHTPCSGWRRARCLPRSRA